jgi:hypothetical protein
MSSSSIANGDKRSLFGRLLERNETQRGYSLGNFQRAVFRICRDSRHFSEKFFFSKAGYLLISCVGGGVSVPCLLVLAAALQGNVVPLRRFWLG